jgi:tetratricopeptide (TPR) repeat protein
MKYSFVLLLLVTFQIYGQKLSTTDSLIYQWQYSEDNLSRVETLLTLAPRLRPNELQGHHSLASQVEQLVMPQYSDLQFNTVLYLKGIGYFRKGDIQKALDFFSRCEDFFQTEYPDTYFRIREFTGLCLMRMDRVDSALEVFARITKFPTLSPEQEVIIKSHMGRLYTRIGDFEKALDVYEQILDANQKGLPISNIYLSLGNIYLRMEAYDQSKLYLKQALIDQSIPIQMKAAILTNLGQVYQKTSIEDSARFYWQKALSLKNDRNPLPQLQTVYLLLASLEIRNDQLNRAKSLIEAYDANCPRFCNPQNQVKAALVKGKLLFAKDNFTASITQFEFAVNLAKRYQQPNLMEDAYAWIADAYQQLGDTDQAFKYNQRYVRFQDSVNRNAKAVIKEYARVKYQTKEKEKALASTSEDLNFYQSLSFKILSFLILFVLISIAIYWYWLQTKKESDLKDDELDQLRQELNLIKQLHAEQTHQSILQLKSKASINVNEIMFIKSDGHYLEFYLSEQKTPEIERSTIKEILESIPANRFIRVHKSYVVNVDFIKIINSKELMLTNGQWIKLSRTYKPALKEMLHQNSAPLLK